MSKIRELTALEILDSLGNPAIAVTAELEDGSTATAAVPSGASTGKHEAFELRDGDPQRFQGKGVLHTVGNVNGELAKRLKGTDAADLAVATGPDQIKTGSLCRSERIAKYNRLLAIEQELGESVQLGRRNAR